MILIGDIALSPEVLVAVAAAVTLAVLWLLASAARRAGRSAAAVDHVAQLSEALARRVEALGEGQQRLAGGLGHVSEAQAAAQAHLLALMEARLSDVATRVGETLTGSASRTARSLGELQQRLETIDRAQAKIEKLSGDVLSLQDILSNKQTRGAFGEIQLADIVGKALPPDSFTFQATLSNGKRADCLIRLPQPPGPIVVDAKFPLESYEALRAASTDAQRREATQAFRAAVRAHLRAIAERYIVEGETADGALMFLPSEAVYAELHAHHAEIVREGFALRVWIVSPTTCMATLNTLRAILKDARMREQAGEIRKALGLLHRDVELVLERATRLDTHFRQTREDVDGIVKAAERAGRRAVRLDAFDFEGPPVDAEAPVAAAPTRAAAPVEAR